MKGREIAYWICQIVGWGAYSIIGASLAAAQIGWQTSVIAGYALFFGYSIALTHGIRTLIHRRQWLQLPARSVLVRLLVAVLLAGTIDTLLVIGIARLLQGRWGAFGTFRFSSNAWLGITGVIGLWTALYAASSAMRRYQEARRKTLELQLAVKDAELRALEAQVQPHFLFNCLNTIRGLVSEDPARAQAMITHLSNLLRYNLQRDRSHTEPLENELGIVSDYLALEMARFEERLQVRFEIAPEAQGFPMPSMVLQTLVENAVKHGIAKLPQGGEVVIRASLEGARLRLEVENPGSGSLPSSEGLQVGLKNTGERLRILYNGSATVTLRPEGGGRVVASLLIPRERAS